MIKMMHVQMRNCIEIMICTQLIEYILLHFQRIRKGLFVFVLIILLCFFSIILTISQLFLANIILTIKNHSYFFLEIFWSEISSKDI